MKIFTNKSVVQKIIIALVLIILFNFCIPPQVNANIITDTFENIAGGLLKEFVHLIASICDVVMGLLNHVMFGTDEMINSVMIDNDQIDAPIFHTGSTASAPETIDVDNLDGLSLGDWKLPNLMYSPEAIFSNSVPALDVNFIRPNSYTDAYGEQAESAAQTLRGTISVWYNGFRNIAIVGLLSVLVYLGIRILLGSTAQDKAKYKERLKDWLIALCLIFVLHLIMSTILMLSSLVTSMVSADVNSGINITLSDGRGDFDTNYMGYIRFMAQSSSWGDATAYTIMYMALVIFTCMFTVTYLKRFLYMAFLTMIAPLVALSYPIDKIRDGKAQAFNMWFKEYVMHAIIQPIHLLLYYTLISSAIELAIDNVVYACVALAFLLPAEKFIKKMFGLESDTGASLGMIAGGSLAIQGVNSAINMIRGGKSNSNSNGGKNDNDDEDTLISRGKNIGYSSNPINTILGGQLPGGGLPGNNNPPPGGALPGNNNPPPGGALPGNNNPPPGGALPANNNPPPGGALPGNNNPPPGGALPGSNNPPPVIPQQRNNNPPQPPTQQPTRTTGERFKRGMSALGNRAIRGIANTVSPSNLAKAGKRTIKGIARTGVKVGGAALGATALGVVAAGAALATGDLSKGAGILAGGITAGAAIGGNIAQGATEKLELTGKSAYETFMNAAYTEDERKAKKQEKYDKQWKNDNKNYDYLINKGMRASDAKDYLKDQDTQRFLNAGITDINTIYNARKLGYGTDGAIARAELAKGLKDDFETDVVAQDAFRNSMMSKGLTTQQANQLIDDISKIKKKN